MQFVFAQRGGTIARHQAMSPSSNQQRGLAVTPKDLGGKPMKHASAYLRKDKIFLNPFSTTTKGFLIMGDPLVLVDHNATELGGKVLSVLSHSTVDVPQPESWGGGPPEAMAKAAGVRSYEAFADLAKCVAISQDDHEVVFTPTRNGGRGKRFLHFEDQDSVSAGRGGSSASAQVGIQCL